MLVDNKRKEYQNVTRWFRTIIAQKDVHQVVGDVQLAKEVAKFCSKWRITIFLKISWEFEENMNFSKIHYF